MSFNINFDFWLTSVITGVDEEHLGPSLLAYSDGGNSLRRTLGLDSNKWTTLDAGDMTPWFWLVVNLGNVDVELGFGQGVVMTIASADPKEIAFWPGTAIPSVRASGGAGSILYWVIEK